MRERIYCDKCKQTHYIRVCDLCGKELANQYPDFTMQLFEFAVLNVKVEVEMCDSCKKELLKSCKQLRKANKKLKKEQEDYKRIAKKIRGQK